MILAIVTLLQYSTNVSPIRLLISLSVIDFQILLSIKSISARSESKLAATFLPLRAWHGIDQILIYIGGKERREVARQQSGDFSARNFSARLYASSASLLRRRRPRRNTFLRYLSPTADLELKSHKAQVPFLVVASFRLHLSSLISILMCYSCRVAHDSAAR